MFYLILKYRLDFLVFILLAYLPYFIWLFSIRKKQLPFRVSGQVLTLIFLLSVASWFVSGWMGSREKQSLVSTVKGLAPTYAHEMRRLGHAGVLLGTSPEDPLYLRLIDTEKNWLRLNPSVADIYTFRKLPDGKVILAVDSETDYDHNGRYEEAREQRTPMGEVYPEADEKLFQAFTGENVFDDVPYTDRWGTWVSAYSPIYDAAGNVEAVLGVDYEAKEWVQQLLAARILGLTMMLMVILALITAHIFYIQMKHIRESSEELLSVKLQNVHQSKMAGLGEMAGGIAHEINTPLGVIMGRSELLRAELESPSLDQAAAKHMIEGIEAMTQRIARIVKSLRSLSRDASVDPMGTVSLRNLLMEVSDLCSERFRARGVDFQTHFPDEDIKVKGRNSEIAQVLLNLLNNAFDATEGRPVRSIVLSVKVQPKVILVSVSDSGSGIPAELREKIFEPFFTTKTLGKGTGLGLSISKRIIDQHQGRLYIDEAYTAGTRMILELPLL